VKSTLLILVQLFSFMAYANVDAITEKLGEENAIVKQCKQNAVKVNEQRSHNLAIVRRSELALGSKTKDGTAADQQLKADIREEYLQASLELERLTTEDIAVTLIAAPINEFAVLKLDVNCKTAVVVASLNTFVSRAEVLHPVVVSLDINQNNINNPVGIIHLEEMFVPTSANDFIQTAAFTLSIDSNNTLRLNSALSSMDLNENVYTLPIDAHSRLASLQALIGITNK
jgi:hypothetical protein